MRTRPFLLGLSLGILLGIAAASAVDWWSERNMRPIQRTAEAARAAEYTYLLYLYAPYPVAVGFLDRESSLLQRLAAEASTENERNSFLRDLAASEARLARLHARNDHQDAADRAIAQAVGHLRDSGSTCVAGCTKARDCGYRARFSELRCGSGWVAWDWSCSKSWSM